MPEYKTVGQYRPNNLIAGDFPIVTDSITIASGQNLSQGAVLGEIGATGHYVLSDEAATDGSEVPSVILAEAVDATNTETKSVCFLSGQFNANALTFGSGHTLDSIRHGLRALNIYLTNSQ